MAELPLADRVVALLEWGDVAEADAAIAAAQPGWQPLLWLGARALMEGRFHLCEGLARAASSAAGEEGDAAVTLLLAALRREQERPAEAESLLRSAVDRQPAGPVAAGASALLALVVGEMGRDAQARAELSRLLPREPMVAAGHVAYLFLLSELAASVDAPADDVDLLYRRLLPHAGDFAVEPAAAVFHGSVSLALGRLAQARGAWEDAIAHYQQAEAAHRRVGAPVLLAHVQRHLAALLRTRSGEGDWERAVALLAEAAAVYRIVGVDGLAAKTQAVLARAEDGLASADHPEKDGVAPGTLFRRREGGWAVGPPGDPAHLPDGPGMDDLARLLAAPGAGLHVGELMGPGPLVEEASRCRYETRLDELAAAMVEAEEAEDAVAAALVRAERDVLVAVLEDPSPADPLDLARRMVAIRIRMSLDRIEQVRPGLGRHLRRSIRTGTFCAYAPERRVRWAL
ncbi:MAG: hypothetical protein ACLGI2_13875 [Acidimicrobiia bacterium]